MLRQARRNWVGDPQLREKYRKFRPNVERVISQLANRGGRRVKLRYRGTVKNNAWLTRRTAGLNLRNLLSRGLSHGRSLGSHSSNRLTTPPAGLDRRRHPTRIGSPPAAEAPCHGPDGPSSAPDPLSGAVDRRLSPPARQKTDP